LNTTTQSSNDSEAQGWEKQLEVEHQDYRSSIENTPVDITIHITIWLWVKTLLPKHDKDM